MSQSVREIFDLLLGVEKDNRDAELERLCGDDPQRIAEVQSLLRAHDEAGEFLASPTLDSPEIGLQGDSSELEETAIQHERQGSSDYIGQVVGHYKLLEKIGEGGFGYVFMAQQSEPIRRRVALKIIKLGMDTKQVVARFEAERQALAVMDHPNVARVIDGGSTETGRPFFVMELVRGDPVIEYCDQNRLPLRERLELFQQICRAISHAHQKGIIHRDIKPSNVLVTIADDRPLVKVIDFGIAKATTAELTDKTLFTEFRQLLGTPLYMSPEQAQRSGVDVDTRTDIYSLGVLLYEVLTGRTPLDPKKLNSAAWAEWQRMIVEDEPSRPSIMVASSQNADLIEVARRRSVEASKLGSLLRGDLDWIVLKAIDKDRSRRYDTVAALSDDIQRFLAGDAVLATPPSRAYRIKKFVTRNRAWIGTAAALLTMLVVGLISTSVTAAWAIRSAREATASFHLAKANERQARRAVTLASASQTLPESEARKISASWLNDIETMDASSADQAKQREIEKAQHAVWFANWLVRNNHHEEAVRLFDTSYQHAKEWLGVDDASFLQLCNDRILAMEQIDCDPNVYATTYEDLIASLRAVHGESDAALLLPQMAAALVKANRLSDAKASVDQFAEFVSSHQTPMSPEINLRLDVAIDRIMNWGGIDPQGKASELLETLQQIRATGTSVGTDEATDRELAADLEMIQGKWRYKGWQQGKLVEHMVAEFEGSQTETRFLDENGKTIRGRKTRFELSRSGGVKVFKSYQAASPDVGGAFVYEIRQHRLTLVSGLLQNEASLPEIKLRHFYRMKPGETDSGSIDEELP